MTTTHPSASTAQSATVRALRETYSSGRTRPLAWRTAQLDGLLRLLADREDDIVDAIQADMGRPAYEGWLGEVGSSRAEIKHLRKHVAEWMQPTKVKVPGLLRPARAESVSEPLGVALVIAPWNYPVYLALTPLAAALAAGNCVVVKPSEVAPASSALLARLLPEYLDPEAVAVVEGGVSETTDLLAERFDHILYTGGPAVGRIVAEAAAKHLTPVTLELGGKSPVIVHRDANLTQAARRVAFAKWGNAGQTCIAADHVYVHRDVEDEFASLLAREVKARYGADPRQSSDYGRIINERHAERIASLLDAGGFDRTEFGGDVDTAERYIAPTLLRGVRADAKVMSEEIFGPVLPLLAYDDLAEPIAAINADEKPLALYVFTRDNEVADRVLAETSSGGACVNEAMMHVLVSDLPFGGVGQSGYGAYHGKAGFDTFSHHKSVLRRPGWLPELPAGRPPYRKWKLRMMKRFL